MPYLFLDSGFIQLITDDIEQCGHGYDVLPLLSLLVDYIFLTDDEVLDDVEVTILGATWPGTLGWSAGMSTSHPRPRPRPFGNIG